MKSISFIICFMYMNIASGQGVQAVGNSEPCPGMDSAMRVSGKWKKVEDNIVFPDKTFPSSQYKLLRSRMDSIYEIVKKALPDLKGFQAEWYRSIRGDSYQANGPVPYSLQCLFKEYYCNTNVNRTLLGDETSDWVYVFVNRVQWFMYDVDTMRINDDGRTRQVYQLPPRVGKLGNYNIYELKVIPSQFGYSRCIILGRNGKVPWRTLTRKEYLTGLKNNHLSSMAVLKSGSGFELDHKKKVEYIDAYLATASEEELSKPVVIDPKVGIWGFKGKFGDEENGGFKLVLSGFHEKYFDMSLPRYVPQVIQIYWSYGKSALATKFREQFEKNLEIGKLKAMMDK